MSAIPQVMPHKLQRRNYLPNSPKVYDSSYDPTGWFVPYNLCPYFSRMIMEKFDGVRIFWDGSKLHSKHTNVSVQVPKDLNFPSIPFEGELW